MTTTPDTTHKGNSQKRRFEHFELRQLSSKGDLVKLMESPGVQWLGLCDVKG